MDAASSTSNATRWLVQTQQAIARAQSGDDLAQLTVNALAEHFDTRAVGIVRVGPPPRVLAARGRIDEHAVVACKEARFDRESAVLPLVVGGEVHGVLYVEYVRVRSAMEAEEAQLLLSAVGVTAALALARQAHEEAQRLSLERDRIRRYGSHGAVELLAQAGSVLSSSLDVEATLRDVVRLSVPTLADWCAIDVLDERGFIKRVAVMHPNPQMVELAHDLERRYPSPTDAPTGVPHVLRTGKTDWMHEIPQEFLRAGARDEEHGRIIERLGLRSYICVPLISHGRVHGALTLVQAESNRLYDENDVRLAEDLGRRAGQALENAMLYRDTEVMHNLGLTLAAELDQKKVVDEVTGAATRLAGAQFGAFFYNVLNERGESYMLYAIAGVPREQFSKFPMPRNTKLFAPTFAGQGVVRVEDITKDARYGHNPPHHGMPAGHLPVRSYLAVPVVSRNGGVIGGLFFGHEKPGMFTERAEKLVVGLAAQAAVAMDNAALFQRSERLIQTLERTNQELDQFAYVTSHDLKAPLRGIANLASWIEEDAAGALNEKSTKHLELMKGRIRRMEALIDGILDYSRAGKSKAQAEPIELDKLVRDVADLVAPKAPARIDVDAELPTLFAEKVPLTQVLQNLINNGLKHAKRDDAVVRVSARADGDFVEVSVGDNGPGIAAEFHYRIWGIFQTLEARDKHESTGIGLAIVRRVVEQRGGRAWVESNPGEGAVFKFRWPKQQRVGSEP